MKISKRYKYIFQFIFWTLYFLYLLLFVYTKAQNDFVLLSGLFSLSYFGTILSFILEFVFYKVDITSKKITNIGIIVVFSSIALAHIWSFEILLIDYSLSNLGYPVTNYTLRYYFWEIISQSAVLISWCSIYLTLLFWKKNEEHHKLALKIKDIESKKYQSELIALKSQINPHFLFNVLNTIYSHSLTNSVKTSEIVLKLSELLSYILYDANEKLISIHKEKLFIENYLNLEKTRLEDRISIDFNFNVAEFIKIPPLLILPVLENAFKHSNANSYGIRFVKINILYSSNQLFFEIENSINTKLQSVRLSNNNGIGILNTKTRLKLLYDNNATYICNMTQDSYYVKLILKNVKNDNFGMCYS